MKRYYFKLIVMLTVLLASCEEQLPEANFEMLKVQNLSAAAGDEAVNLFWEKNPNGSPSGYAVSWAPGDSSIIVKGEELFVEGLTNTIEYTFSVQAIYGDKGRAAAETIKVKPITSRHDVSNFTVLAGSEKVLVKWKQPLNSELLGYKLKINPGNLEITLNDPHVESYLIEELQNDIEYTIALISIYPHGPSDGLTATATPGEIIPLTSSKAVALKEEEVSFNYNPMYFLGDVSSVVWDFGDGQTSTEDSPVHQYSTLGKYTVALTVNFVDNSTEKVSLDLFVTGVLWESIVNRDGSRGEIKASAPAIGADGTVYVNLSTNGDVYAFNPDGSVKWRFDKPTKGSYGGGPMIGADGTIYSASQDGNLYAINPNGTEKWSFSTGNDIRAFPALGGDGTIYIATRNSPRKLYAVNPDGSEKWSFELDNTAGAIAVGQDNTIYVGTSSSMYAVNPDGTEKWSASAKITEMSGIAIKDNTIYAGGMAGEGLYAFSSSGQLLWTFSIPVDIYSPAIDKDGTIYVTSKNINTEGGGVLFAINPDGTQKWKFVAGGGFNYASPTIDENGVIYVGCERGGADKSAVYAINNDGSIRWKISRGAAGQIFSTPAISIDGMLYIGDIGDATSPGSLFAIPVYASHADPVQAWYTRGGNNMRTHKE